MVRGRADGSARGAEPPGRDRAGTSIGLGVRAPARMVAPPRLADGRTDADPGRDCPGRGPGRVPRLLHLRVCQVRHVPAPDTDPVHVLVPRRMAAVGDAVGGGRASPSPPRRHESSAHRAGPARHVCAHHPAHHPADAVRVHALHGGDAVHGDRVTRAQPAGSALGNGPLPRPGDSDLSDPGALVGAPAPGWSTASAASAC